MRITVYNINTGATKDLDPPSEDITGLVYNACVRDADFVFVTDNLESDYAKKVKNFV